MTMEQFTRCPGCRTVFRVTPAQLALRDGQVRCGHCRTVFNGTGNLIQLARSPAFPSDDDTSTGPLTVTLRNAHALEPVGAGGRATVSAAPFGAAAVAAPPAAPATASTTTKSASRRNDDEDEIDYDHRFAWDRPRKRSPGRTALYAIAALVLVLALAGQLVAHYRDAVAAHWPASRPLLVRACAIAGCEVRPLRDIAGLSIDASDLQADPAQRGLLVLSATIRNRATYAVAIPYLELTLTDGKDNVVVRRALAPSEYVPAADAAGGIPGNGEVAVKLHIDASATTQSGYRVYLFYP